MNELRFALRRSLKNPGFTAVAVLTLAICIGASLAIYAVVDAVLVRPLPFPDADRLVTIHNAYPGTGIERGNASVANYFERRQTIDAFESVSLFTEIPYIVGEAGSSRRVTTARVTPAFFRTLRVPLAMGREFTDDELDHETGRVAIITDEFWRSYFDGNPKVLGRTLLMQTFPVSATARCDAVGVATGYDTHRHWHCGWIDWRLCSQPAAADVALWRQSHRSYHVRHGLFAFGGHGISGVLYPCAPRDQDRADGGVAL